MHSAQAPDSSGHASARRGHSPEDAMKQVLKLAPLMLALTAVAMPAAAKDKWRGHDKHDR